MWRSIYNVFLYSRYMLALAGIVSLVSGACSAILLTMVGRGLNAGTILPSSYGFIFSFLVLATFLTACASQMLSAHLTISFAMKMRIEICQAVVQSSLGQLEAIGKERIIAALEQDASTIAAAAMQLPQLCMNSAIIGCCLAYLGYVSLPVCGGIVLLLGLSVVSYVAPKRMALRYVALERDSWDALMTIFQAVADGIKELKLNRRRAEHLFSKRLLPATDLSQRYSQQGTNIYITMTSWSNMLCFIVLGLLLCLFPRLTQVARDILITSSIIVLYLKTPVAGLLEALQAFDRASVSLRKIKALGLPLNRQLTPGRGEQESWRSFVRIDLCDVTHGYSADREERPFTLGPVSLAIEAGKLLFVVGGNGSGKTTLGKLIVGLYIPESGQISCDGVFIDDHNRDDYRQLFAAVFSDFALFSDCSIGSVYSADKVDHYLRLLQLEGKVKVIDGRLSTTRLSSGQRRRLALLQAYLEDRPVYLFDEWAADQDSGFKEIFYNRLLPDLRNQGKAVIVISHDQRFYQVADEVVILDSGQFVNEPRSYDSWVPSEQQAGPGNEGVKVARAVL